MAYEYTLMTYADVEEDLRGIFGIDEDILPDDVIHRLPNMPAAEIEVDGRISVDLSTLTAIQQSKAKLAVLYVSAANCLTAVRVNVLRMETDNKTTGQRFEDALSVTEDDLRKKADKFIKEVEDLISGAETHPDLLEFVRPSTDVITGGAYDS